MMKGVKMKKLLPYMTDANGIRYRRGFVDGKPKNFIINELGEIFSMNLMPRKVNKPSGKNKYFSIGYSENGKKRSVSLHKCLMETFNGLAIADANWIKLRPASFSEEQWMGFSVEQREFMSKSGIHVDHMNGKKLDNTLSNLQYLWASDNVAKGNSSPEERTKAMFKKTRALVEEVCYKRSGILVGEKGQSVDLTSYENMISFIVEEFQTYKTKTLADFWPTKFEMERMRKMKKFLAEHKIAA
jgi:hypothetical protein